MMRLVILFLLFSVGLYSQSSDLIQVTEGGIAKMISLNQTISITEEPGNARRVLYGNMTTQFVVSETMDYFRDTSCNLFISGNVGSGAILINKRFVDRVVKSPTAKAQIIMTNGFRYDLLQSYAVMTSQFLESSNCGADGGETLWRDNGAGGLYPIDLKDIGIGNVNPLAPLDVTGNASIAARMRNTDEIGVMEFGFDSKGGKIVLRDSNGVSLVQITNDGASYMDGGSFRLGQYIDGEYVADSLGKTESNYIISLATDGTLLMFHKDSIMGIPDSIYLANDTLRLLDGLGEVGLDEYRDTSFADGVTITGDGSGGDPFAADTTLLATTGALLDTLAAFRDTLTATADGVTITGNGTGSNPFAADTTNVIATKYDLTQVEFDLNDVPSAESITATDELIWADSTIAFQKLIDQTRDSLQVDTLIAINTAVSSATVTSLIKNRKDVHLFLTMTSAESQDESIVLPAVSGLSGKEGLRVSITVKDTDNDYDYYVLPTTTNNLPELLLGNGRYASRYYFDPEETAVFVLTRTSSGLVWKLESTTVNLHEQTFYRGDLSKRRFFRGQQVKTNLGRYVVRNTPVQAYNSNNPDSMFVFQVKDKAPWSKNYCKQSENLIIGSYPNAWAYPGEPDIIVLRDFTTAPNGTEKTAERWVRNSSGGNSAWTPGFTTQTGEQWTISFWAKSGIAASNDNAYLRLQLVNDNLPLTDVQIDNVWRKYSVTQTVIDAFATESYNIIFAGDAGDSIDITGIQIELGGTASDYKETNTLATTEGVLYLVYQPEDGTIKTKDIYNTRLSDSQLITKSISYCQAVPECGKISISEPRTIRDQVSVPEGIEIFGSHSGSTDNTDYTKAGTILTIDLRDSTKSAFVLEDITSYAAGNVVRGFIMQPVSAGLAAITMQGGMHQRAENITINNFINSTRYLKHGIINKVDGADNALFSKIENCHIRKTWDAAISSAGVGTEIKGCSMLESKMALVSGGSIHIEDTWFEDIDSSAIIHDGSGSVFSMIGGGYTENVPISDTSTVSTFVFKTAAEVNIIGATINGSASASVQAGVELQNVKTANISGNKIINVGKAFTTTSATGETWFVGNSYDGVCPPDSWEGIADSLKVIAMANGGVNSNKNRRNYIPRLESYDALIALSRVDSTDLNDTNLNGEIQLNAPTVTNRNENIVPESEKIQHGIGGWTSSVMTLTQNDTLYEGAAIAEKIEYNTGNLLRFTPTVTLETGQWYTISFWVATPGVNQKLSGVIVQTGDVASTNQSVTFGTEGDWVEYVVMIKHAGGTNEIDFEFQGGAAGKYVHMTRVQVERNRYKGEYIQTTGSAIQASSVDPKINIPDGDKLHLAGAVEIDSLIVTYSRAVMSFVDSSYVIDVSSNNVITNDANDLYSSYTYTVGGCITMQGDSIIINCDGVYQITHNATFQSDGGGVFNQELLLDDDADGIFEEIEGVGVQCTSVLASGIMATPTLHYLGTFSAGDVIKPAVSKYSGTGDEEFRSGQLVVEKL